MGRVAPHKRTNVRERAQARGHVVETMLETQFREAKMASILKNVIENLKQDNQEELQIRAEYGLK